MSDNTLKEFLVKLGFKIDARGERKFGDSVAGATLKVVELGTAITATAASVVAGVAKISNGLEKLYYQSQRASSSAENLQAFGQAAAQLGGDSAIAITAVTELGDKLRELPNMESSFKRLGIETRGAGGELRNTTDLLIDFAKASRNMPQYQAVAMAGMFGLDKGTLYALQRDPEMFERIQAASRKSHEAMGMDFEKTTKDSTQFMNSLRGLGNFSLLILQKVASLLQDKFGSSIKNLTATFERNGPRIAEILAHVAEVIVQVGTKLTSMVNTGIDLIEKLYDKWKELSPMSQKIILWVGGIALAWKILSAGFLASPIGMVMLLATSLLAVYDDYKQWKAGSKDGFIDWDKWAPAFEAFLDGMKQVGEWINKATAWMGDWQAAGVILLAYLTGTFLTGLAGFVASAATTLATGVAGAVGGAFAGLGGMLSSALGALLSPGGLLVAAAGALGYGIGSLIYKQIENDEFATNMGRSIAKMMAALGSTTAQEALDAEENAKHPKPVVVVKGKPSSTEQYAMGVFEKMGWAHEQAAGIVANLSRESKMNPNAVGDNGKAKGIAQWHPDRQANFAALFGHGIDKSNLDEQLKFVDYELRQGSETAAGKMLLAAKNASMAGAMMSKYYERPADQIGEMDLRAGNAGRLAKETPVITQTNTITITGTADPVAAGREVNTAMNSVNENMVRNMRGAAQ